MDLRQGGMNDWFLPGRDELELMYLNLHVNGYGGFTTARSYYSSEAAGNQPTSRNFANGGMGQGNMTVADYRARAIRAF